jgi:hypothetical protein
MLDGTEVLEQTNHMFLQTVSLDLPKQEVSTAGWFPMR